MDGLIRVCVIGWVEATPPLPPIYLGGLIIEGERGWLSGWVNKSVCDRVG